MGQDQGERKRQKEVSFFLVFFFRVGHAPRVPPRREPSCKGRRVFCTPSWPSPKAMLSPSSSHRVSTFQKIWRSKLFFSPNETVDRLRPTPTSVGQGGTQGPPIALTMAPDGLRSFASPSASRLFSLFRAREGRIFFGVSMFGSRRYLYIRSHGKVTSLEGKSTPPSSVPKPTGLGGGGGGNEETIWNARQRCN